MILFNPVGWVRDRETSYKITGYIGIYENEEVTAVLGLHGGKWYAICPRGEAGEQIG